MKKLLCNVNANITGDNFFTDGSQEVLAVYATSFGGGTVTVESSPDGIIWITLKKIPGNTPATFTENEMTVCYEVPMSYYIRARLTGATNPLNVNCDLGQ